MHTVKVFILVFSIRAASFGVPAPIQDTQAAKDVRGGVVQKFLTNPEGEIDGFLLDGGQLVHFSPSLSGPVSEQVKIGEAVKLEGEKLPDGEIKASAVINKENKRVVEKSSAPHSGKKLDAMKQMKVQGRIARIFLSPSKDIKQVLLSDGSQIRVPREAAVAIRNEFKEGSEFAAEGMGTENEYGRSIEATAVGTSLKDLQPIFGKNAPAE